MAAFANRLGCALAIGGLDPGGGAGLAADLRAFGRAGAFGCAAIAVLTVQSTSGLRTARAIAPREMVAQVREVVEHQRVHAIKTGALGSAANVRALAAWLGLHREIPVVIDTVLLPTLGRPRLLSSRALGDLKRELFPRAWLVTANAPEAAAITGMPVTTLPEAREAARAMKKMGPRAVLVKGGHLRGELAVDVLATHRGVTELRARRLAIRSVHGGGCVLASLIAGRIAVKRESLLDTVRWAKRAHHRLLARAVDVGGELRVLVV